MYLLERMYQNNFVTNKVSVWLYEFYVGKNRNSEKITPSII